MDANTEKLLERIRKMLAIAQDARANPNEAANAAAMAEKLMRKHQLEYADVVAAELKRSDAFDHADVAAVMKRGQGHLPRAVPLWAQSLAVRVAQLNDCGVRNAFDNYELGACLRFFGYKADLACATYTFDYLVGATIRAVRDFQAAGRAQRTPRSKRESNSFRTGFVLALGQALEHAIAARRQENAAAVAGRALVVAKGRALAERFGEFTYGESKGSAEFDEDALLAGIIRGREVDVNRRGLQAADAEAQQLLEG